VRVKRFKWNESAFDIAAEMRKWTMGSIENVDVEPIRKKVMVGGDEAVLALCRELDPPGPESLQVEPAEAERALAELKAPVREAIDLAEANIRAVAEAQVGAEPRAVELPQGQTVTIREVAVGSAGIYAPGGRAAYPSSVLMCCIPARVAGVERIAVASPTGPDGKIHDLVLAAAALCEVDEIYAMGGAHAVFALAVGTETIEKVDVIAGPGNAWVQEAKRRAYGRVGIDSYAGPSELMVAMEGDVNLEWIALDLCAQAEHGSEGPLVVAACDADALKALEDLTINMADDRPGVGNAPLATICVPTIEDAIDLANVFAPEHLELLAEDHERLVERVHTAGCVLVGATSATAFGDYVAGSNHVLPTLRSGRFAGPLGPDTFRRKISTVEVPREAAAKLAPHVDVLARAEGFPVHGESAMIRSKP
jgi:histidinol dehydrogenase